jgi:glycosyltransferase involved in cell wall biosynthesis
MPESISVVIPTYNRENMICRAILSVLGQTHPVDEIIVVDDGSTDGTKEKLETFGGQIRYFRTTNRGASSARNFGCRNASSSWITFLDSDDQWHPQKIKRQLEILAEFSTTYPIFTGAVDEEDNRLDDLLEMHPQLQKSSRIQVESSDSQFFLFPRHPFLQSLMVRKDDLIAAGGFDECAKVAEDTKLLYRLALNHGYIAIGEPLVTIQRRRTTPGLSDQLESKAAQVRYLCYTRVQSEFYWHLLPTHPVAAAKVRRNLKYFISRSSELASVNHDYRLTRRLGREGLSLVGKPREQARCLLAILFPQLLAYLVSRKWS